MTENIPPVPPVPHPHANWPQPGQGSYPSHGPNGPVPGNEPPYGPPQPYTPAGYGQQQYAQPGYGQQPYPPQQAQAQYQQPFFQPGWVAPAPKPSSGVRTASGVLTIVLGAWLLLCAFSGFGGGKGGFGTLLLLLAAASLTAGILVLVLRRNKGVQVFALVCAGVAGLLALIAPLINFYGVVLPVSLLPLAVAGCILSGISVSRESRTV